MSKKVRNIIIASVVLIAVVVGYLVFRNIYLSNRYAPFEAAMEDGEDYIIYKDKYNCSYAKPNSLTSLRGNLAVSYIRHLSQAGGKQEIANEDGCDLIIYVDFPNSYTVMAQLFYADGGNSEDIYLTENMELVSEEYRDLYEKYYDEILGAFSAAHDVFGIFTLPNQE